MESRDLTPRVRAAFTLAALTVAVRFLSAAALFLLDRVGAFDGLSDYTANFLLPQAVYPLLNLALTAAFFAASDVPARAALPFRRPRAGELLPWLGVFAAASVVMNDLVGRLQALLGEAGIEAEDAFASRAPQNAAQSVGYLLVIAVLPALSEEFLCRAWIAGRIAPAHASAAIVLSAFAFAMMHADLLQIPFAFGLGLILGAVYVRTGNLFYPILMHFFNNAWVWFLLVLSRRCSARAAAITQTAGDAFFLLAGIIGAIFLFRARRARPSVPAAPRPLRAVFAAPAFWIFTVLYLILTWV